MSEILTAKAGTRDQASRSIRIGLTLWALAATILCAGIYWFGWSAMFEPSSPDFIPIADFFAFALALFGTIHIGQGLLQSARFGKYGASTLEAGHAQLGKVYRGKIRTDRALEVSGPYTIRLLCESQAISKGDDHPGSKSKSPLWEALASVPASTRSSTGIPFEFRIPADGLANRTGSSVSGYTILWSLSVSAPMAGLHYRATFPIDVSAASARTEEDEDEAPTGPASFAEAFVGQAKPERSGLHAFHFILPIAGILLFGAGAYATANQWSHGRDGVVLAGKITAINPPGVEVALDGGGGVRIARVTKYTAWQVGQPVRVTCLRDGGEMRSCRMDTGSDRWIDALGTLAVGAVLLLFGGWLWRRRQATGRTQSAGA